MLLYVKDQLNVSHFFSSICIIVIYHIFISNTINFAHTQTPEEPQRYQSMGRYILAKI
jgi:hypothetical protein